MTKTTIDETQSNEMTEGQLYWDDQDPKNAGWWLRYRDDAGIECGSGIDDIAEDASTEELAQAVAAATYRCGTVKVYRGEQPRGWIKVEDGSVVGWSAL